MDPWDPRGEKSEGSFNGHRCWSRKFSMKRGLFHMIKITTWSAWQVQALFFFTLRSVSFNSIQRLFQLLKEFLFFLLTNKEGVGETGPPRARRGRVLGFVGDRRERGGGCR